jgi:hypothetical protein
MWNKPSPVLILFTLVLTSVPGYVFYEIWFNTDSLHERTNKSLNKLPSWFPFKRYYFLRLQEKKSWIIARRIINIVMMIFVLFFDTLILLAILYGK